MIVVRIALGTLKVLMLLGLVNHIAPGLSHEIAKELTNLMFEGIGDE